MLDRHEDAALAEIEAALRRDDPDFVQLLECLDVIDLTAPVAEAQTVEPVVVPTVAGTSRRRFARRLVVSLALVIVAVALTLVVAVLFGPDAGGLVGVVSLSAAGMFGYQRLRGCPGLRRRDET